MGYHSELASRFSPTNVNEVVVRFRDFTPNTASADWAIKGLVEFLQFDSGRLADIEIDSSKGRTFGRSDVAISGMTEPNLDDGTWIPDSGLIAKLQSDRFLATPVRDLEKYVAADVPHINWMRHSGYDFVVYGLAASAKKGTLVLVELFGRQTRAHIYLARSSLMHVVPVLEARLRNLNQGRTPAPDRGTEEVIPDFERYPCEEFGDLTPAVARMRLEFGFTKTEAKVTMLLMRGQSVRDIADNTCVAISTVRTHLQHAYQKTSTHRQSELVAFFGHAR